MKQLKTFIKEAFNEIPPITKDNKLQLCILITVIVLSLLSNLI